MNRFMKNILLGITVLMILLIPVYSAITVTPATNAIGSVNNGVSKTGNFVINNTGAVISSLYLELNQNKVVGSLENSSIAISFAPSSLTNLATGVLKQMNYTFIVPNAYASSYTGTINIKNSTNALIGTHAFTFTINQASNLTMSAPSTTVVSGTSKDVTLTLTNGGNTHISAITFDITDFTNTQSSSDTILRSNFVISNGANVDYKESKSWTLSITVPSGKFGTYTGNITANYDGKQYKYPFTFIVEAERLATSITANDLTWSKGVTTQASLSFDVTNTGNKPLTNYVCTISDFKNSAGQTAIAGTYISSTSFTISTLAVGEKVTRSATITGVPTNLTFGAYTSTISCTNPSFTKNVILTYRNRTTAISVPSSVTLGSSTQLRNQTITQTFNVVNSGDTQVTNLLLTISGSNGLRFTENNLTTYTISSLNAGQTATINLKIKTDYEFDTGRRSIGTIVFSSSSLLSSSSMLVYVETKSMLRISDAYVKVNSAKDDITPSSSGGSSGTADIKPGSRASVTVDVENLYSDSNSIEKDIDIKDIQLTVEVDDLDVNVDSSTFSVQPQDSKSVTVSFDIPYVLKNDDYTMNLIVDGKDTEGASHTVEWSARLTVKRESRELKILTDSSGFSNSEVYCDSDTYYSITAVNLGERELDNVILELKSITSGLDYRYSEKVDKLSNDYGDSDSEITLNNKVINLKNYNLKPGTYTFQATVFYNNNQFGDSKQFTLKCTEAPIKTSTSQTSTTTGSSSGTTGTGSSQSSASGTNSDGSIVTIATQDSSAQSGIATTTSGHTATDLSSQKTSTFDDFRNSDGYVYFLVGAILFLVVLFLIVVFVL